jgi:general secretion pathway protein B
VVPADLGADRRGPPTESELDEELQRELERQLAIESETIPVPEPDEPPEPAPTPVPRELIAEIEAFKDQLRRGPGKSAAPAKQADLAKAQDPTTLRLTSEQKANLPAFMMTVHVYLPDKAKRFVLINGIKYGEGDKTREDLKVEQILPDGAVLSFQGNPFYMHR